MGMTKRIIPTELQPFHHSDALFADEFNAVGAAIEALLFAIQKRHGDAICAEYYSSVLLPMLADMASVVMFADECDECGKRIYPTEAHYTDGAWNTVEKADATHLHVGAFCSCGYGWIDNYDLAADKTASRQGS